MSGSSWILMLQMRNSTAEVRDAANGGMLPISVTCHHATMDGYHVDMFLKDLQKLMDSIVL